MWQFLYYNENSINSFLAQIEQGILVKNKLGKTGEETTSRIQEIQLNITGDLSVGGAPNKSNLNFRFY